MVYGTATMGRYCQSLVLINHPLSRIKHAALSIPVSSPSSCLAHLTVAFLMNIAIAIAIKCREPGENPACKSGHVHGWTALMTDVMGCSVTPEKMPDLQVAHGMKGQLDKHPQNIELLSRVSLNLCETQRPLA